MTKRAKKKTKGQPRDVERSALPLADYLKLLESELRATREASKVLNDFIGKFAEDLRGIKEQIANLAKPL